MQTSRKPWAIAIPLTFLAYSVMVTNLSDQCSCAIVLMHISPLVSMINIAIDLTDLIMETTDFRCSYTTVLNPSAIHIS